MKDYDNEKDNGLCLICCCLAMYFTATQHGIMLY